MPELTEEALKTAMEVGSFYFCVEPGASGEALVPRITNIAVDSIEQTITIEAEGVASILWIGPGIGQDHAIAVGPVFNFTEYENQPFIRAILKGPQGDCYTQPFGMTTE
jgi:hypothetical protein